MVGSLARRCTGSALLLAGLFLALGVGSASAALKAFQSPPQFNLGPLRASHGFKVTISGGCNQKPDYANVMVTKRGHHYVLSYDYSPRFAATTTCNVTRNMGTGSLTLKWGRAVQASLKFAATGPQSPITLKGCTGTFGHMRKVQGSGTLKLAIHTKVLGKLVLHTVPAQIQVNGAPGHCPPIGSSTNFVNLTAFWPPHSNRQLNGYKSPTGNRSLYVSVQNHLGRLYQDVADEFTGSRRLFSFASNLSAAHIGSPGPLLSGSLSYSATRSCAANVTTGTFKGKLVVRDPVLGPLTFWGYKAQQPILARGNSCATS